MAYIPHDKFARRAKQEGYRARSACKLLDLQKKFRIIRKGDRTLDLGAAPGSWLQVAASIVGGKGSVVGVDIAAIEPLKISQVRVFQKDIFDADFIEVLEKQGFAKFDVVLSDVAPSTTGIKERDQALSHELSLRVLEIASQLLKKGGIMVIKVFEGPDTPQLTKQVRKYFSHFDLVKPEASTKGNKERYIVAQNYI